MGGLKTPGSTLERNYVHKWPIPRNTCNVCTLRHRDRGPFNNNNSGDYFHFMCTIHLFQIIMRHESLSLFHYGRIPRSLLTYILYVSYYMYVHTIRWANPPKNAADCVPRATCHCLEFDGHYLCIIRVCVCEARKNLDKSQPLWTAEIGTVKVVKISLSSPLRSFADMIVVDSVDKFVNMYYV